MNILLPSSKLLYRVALVLLGAGLACLVTFIMSVQYRSQVALQQTALRQMTFDSERRATALSYFFAEQQDFLVELAGCTELTSYFENKALGMSMEYGLQASRLLATDHFEEKRQAKKLGETPMYDRLAFVDAAGHLLNDSRTKTRPWARRPWRPFLTPRRTDTQLLCDREGGDLHLLISTPIWFKGAYAGQVLGWIPFPRIYDFFISGSRQVVGYSDVIVFRDEYLHIPSSVAGVLPADQPILPSGLHPYEPRLFRSPGPAVRAVYAVRVPAGNTAFSILTIIPSTELLDPQAPRRSLYRIGSLAGLFLAGMGFLVWLFTRVAVLKAHLEETLLRERTVDDKNRQLAAEIMERQRSEGERAKLQHQLQQTQKMESLGSLAGGIAHDMNNVLAAILSLASTHAEDPAGPPRARKAFAIIADAAIRGGRMVQSLLSFARQSPAETRRVDLNALLREVASLLEHTTLARIRLVMDLAEDLRPVHGDASALTHAFMNLCVNAVDAMPDQGLLTLRTRNTDDCWLEAMVEDTGSGMTREVLERAMDPFFTTKAVGKGTGLGLALVYSTVKAHQGLVELWSEPGQGTRITLRLPTCEAEALAPEQVTATAPASSRALAVLVIDDDELIRGSLQEVLEVMGHACTVAANGEEGLARLEAGLNIDAVILDLNMPGLGGAGTLPRLRALRPATPVILSTGRADQAAMALMERHPEILLLAKPFKMQELQQVLEALAEAQARS